jgi:Mor family transcriptional regulator
MAHPQIVRVLTCDVFHNDPEGYRASRLLTADMAEELFLRDLYWAYVTSPIVRFRHLAKTERNAEIVRRHSEGETLAALAKESGISEQRVWRIIQRYG